MMMKKYILATAIVASLSCVATASANAPVPGSVDDPVVTKNYVDQKIREALGGTVPVNTGVGNQSVDANAFEIVQLKSDQILMAKSGAEIIVRRGKTTVVSTDGDSVIDATTGEDVNAGGEIKNNHLMIFPRDTRGLKPDPSSTKEIWIMVRGGYTLK